MLDWIFGLASPFTRAWHRHRVVLACTPYICLIVYDLALLLTSTETHKHTGSRAHMRTDVHTQCTSITHPHCRRCRQMHKPHTIAHKNLQMHVHARKRTHMIANTRIHEQTHIHELQWCHSIC